MNDDVYNELVDLVTEARNPESENIDDMSTEEILHIIN